MPSYTTLLKSLYNSIQLKIQTEKSYVTNASDSLTSTISQAKLEAYQDCAAMVQSQILQQIPTFE